MAQTKFLNGCETFKLRGIAVAIAGCKTASGCEQIEVLNGGIQYTAMLNDTCAETAKEVLDDAGLQPPSESGLVKHSRIVNFPVAYAVNPYKWYEGFQEKYREASYKATRRFGDGWIPAAGDDDDDDDPIFGVPD